MALGYTLISQTGGVARSDGAIIPPDPSNADWQAYQAWLATGNTPTPAAAPAIAIPSQVPMWAMQAALQVAGRYAAINQTISGWSQASDPGEVAAFFAWTMGNYAFRGSSFIATFANTFGLASADIDSLFIAAARIAATTG